MVNGCCQLRLTLVADLFYRQASTGSNRFLSSFHFFTPSVDLLYSFPHMKGPFPYICINTMLITWGRRYTAPGQVLRRRGWSYMNIMHINHVRHFLMAYI